MPGLCLNDWMLNVVRQSDATMQSHESCSTDALPDLLKMSLLLLLPESQVHLRDD